MWRLFAGRGGTPRHGKSPAGIRRMPNRNGLLCGIMAKVELSRLSEKFGQTPAEQRGCGVDWEKLLPPKSSQVLPCRWAVERTFSSIDQNRRMSKDYEGQPVTRETFTYMAIGRHVQIKGEPTVRPHILHQEPALLTLVGARGQRVPDKPFVGSAKYLLTHNASPSITTSPSVPGS
jgi:hypothetical protein